MSSNSFSSKRESEAIEFTSSPSPSRYETADLISRTALAAVVCLKTGANAHRHSLCEPKALASGFFDRNVYETATLG